MTPTATRAPARPTHPDHPAEQAHLNETVQKMLRQIDRWEDRDLNVGADLETSLTLADTSEELAAMLSVHVHTPFFGSLKIRIGGREQVLYIGRYAFKDLNGPHSVVSWESEVGALFYSEATQWQARTLTGVIHRRRQLDVKAKTLLAVTDLYDTDAGGDTGGRETVLIERLSQPSTAGMSEIISTLQPHQSTAMRSEAGKHLILQGSAGSGKTTVAFHRLAWMVHPERGRHQARADRCLVLMPNSVLAHYASRVLPSLGLEGVTVTTAESWALSFLNIEKVQHVDRTLTLILQDKDRGRRSAAWRRAKTMGDLRMLTVIRRHLARRLRANLGTLSYHADVDVNGAAHALTLSNEELHALLDTVLASDPLGGLRKALREATEEELLSRLDISDDALPALKRQLAPDLNRLVGKVFTGLLPVSETRRLLADRASLEEAARGVLPPSLIEALLSDPLAAIARPKGNHADATELPLMLAVAGLLDGLGRRNGRELEPYHHVALDEAQDFAPIIYALLARATRPGHITALGDLNQGLHGYRGPSAWKDVETALPGAQLMTLARSYRSTKQITELASAVAATYNRAGAITGVDRSGSEVRRYTGGSVAALTAQAIKDHQAEGHVNIAVITRRAGEAEDLAKELALHDVHAEPITSENARYRGGVVLMPTVLAKGLEADACVVVSADAATYDPNTEYETRCLYVSLTRGLHALALIAEHELHPLLK